MRLPGRKKRARGALTELDERLIKAIRQAGCPVCRALSQAEERYWFFFLYEGFQGPQAAEDIRRSIGYCSRHLHQLAAHRDLVPAASLAYWSVRGALDRLRETRRIPRRRSTFVTGRRCPVCAQMKPSEEYALWALGDLLERDHELAAIYEQEDGLCWEHAVQALELHVHSAARIRAHAFATLERHVAETRRLQESFDYQKESADSELAKAWQRAFRALRGDPGRVRSE